MAAPINLQANVQIQNLSQMQRQIQQATQNLKINMGGGNAARSLSALSQPLGRLTGQADEFSKSLDAANARVLAFGASVGIVNTLSNAFKSLVNSTIEVEKAITAISVVGDQFAGKNKQLSQGLFSIAKATGQSFEEVSKAALEFSRQGLSLEQTLQRTQDALILTRLTGLDASKSVDGLTASVNAFAKAGLSTTQILNKLAAVDQAFAVSSADLIEGFNRSAAVAQNAGVTFDELAGIITTLQQETSRGGAVIGNALKTIFTRLQDTSTLNQLQNLGVAVQDLEGNLLPARQILQNLAKDVEGLGQITRAGIFKDVAGTFQINQLISLVGDLGKANSVTAKATQVSAGATNEAFTANQKLNQSLDAIINKVSLTGKQLGALLGEIGLGDNLKGILDGINSFLEGATNLLQGDDLGSRFAKGIVKGIGSVLTGPGIGLFLAIIAKLSFDLAKFGVQSLKTFFNIGQSAKEQQQVQESIVQTLIRNKTVLSQILNTQGGQNAQASAFLNILKQEEQVLQNIRTLAGGIAAPVIAQGYRSGPQGLSRGSAGGYLPAQEASDVRRGVGGASPSSKVVSIPNFAFGGGKRGTMIANTSEYIVPNYAGGGSAIFNQDMVKTMGLPPGAKKITASGGFVPNFAIRGLASNVPVLAGRVFESLIRNDKYIDLTENLIRPDIPKGKPYGEAEAKLSVKAALNDNNFGPKKGKGNIVVVPKDASKEYDEQLKEKKGSQIIRARSDKFLRNNIFKTTREILARESAKKSTYSKIPLTGAGGYIPNFANYIFDSDRLGNSSTKILDAILASPAKKNLLSAPAGAGKSTYAASMGKFIKSISDVLNVSENDYFTILSGAGLTEAGAMSVGFSEILASVNESGGKVSYLNVPDEEIKSRRFSRLGSTNDLRNEAQLRATINAPLNEPKFVDYLKGGAKNFDLINEDDKNDQLAVLGLYGNNGKINGSPVYTLESQRPELFKDIKANLQKNVVKLVRGYASRISKSVGVPVIGKDIEKSLNQIPSLSGFMFEDILNQLAGPNFDSNKISGGSRADFPLNDELKRVFGVSGSQKYAEIKLNPFSSDAISSVIAKQRALARGAIAPKEFDPVQVAKWRETAIGIKLGMGGKRAKEASGIRSRLAREMIEAGAIQSYTKQDAETAAIKKYLGLASGGYIPNFASDALQAAISRERSAGISASQIYVDQSPALKSAANPMGLMVANRRDEPAGGFQGVSRARREGMNPKTYGASKGFVPNFVQVPQAILNQNTQANAKATNPDPKNIEAVNKGFADTAGKIFLLQSSMSFLNGAIEDSDTSFARFAQELSSAGANITSLAFLGKEINDIKIDGDGLSSKFGKFAKGLGLAGIGFAAVTEGFKLANFAIKEFSGENQKAALEASRLADATGKASIKLEELSQTRQKELEQSANKILGESGFQSMFGKVMSGIFGSKKQAGGEFATDTIKKGAAQILALGGNEEVIQNIIERGRKTSTQKIGAPGYYGTREVTNDITQVSDIEAAFAKSFAEGIGKTLNEAVGKLKTGIAGLNPTNADFELKAQEIGAKSFGKKSFDKLNENQKNLINDQIKQRKELVQLQTQEQRTQNEINFGERLSLEIAKKRVDSVLEIAKLNIQATTEEEARIQLQEQTLDLSNRQKILNEARLKQLDLEKKKQTDILDSIGAAIDKAQQGGLSINQDNLNQLKASLERIDFSKITDANFSDLATQLANTYLDKNVKQAENLINSVKEEQKAREGLNKTTSDLIDKEKNRKLQIDGINQALASQLSTIDRIASTAASIGNLNISGIDLESAKTKAQITGLQAQLQDPNLTEGQKNAINTQINGLEKIINLREKDKATQERNVKYAELGIEILKKQNELNLLIAGSAQDDQTREKINSARAAIEDLSRQQQIANNTYDAATLTLDANNAALDIQASQIGKVAGAYASLQKQLEAFRLGAGERVAGAQLGLLSATDPNALARSSITQQVELEAQSKGLNDQDYYKFVNQETVLREKQYELAVETSNVRKIELQRELDLMRQIAEISAATDEERLAKIKEIVRARQEETQGFGYGFNQGLASIQDNIDNFRSEIGQQIPTLFSQNLAQGLNDAISGAKSLKDALRDAATSFFQAITQKNIENIANLFTSGLGGAAKSTGFFASGGQVNGGSGVKDDVPAMLMGGEYVIKKSSVQKYGSKFLDSLNRGSIKGFASGGGVQSGSGGFYAPGEYGTGGIRGKRELLSFATQSFSSGQYDTMGGFGMSGASVSLEAESGRLSQFGRQNNPMFERVQESKQQAFDVYLQQLKQEEQYQEQLKEMEAREKERQKQLVTSIVSAVVSSVVSVAGARAKIGAENQSALNQLSRQPSGLLSSLKGAGKGLFTSFGNSLSGEALTLRAITNPALQNASIIGSGRGVSQAGSALLMSGSNTYSKGIIQTGGNSLIDLDSNVDLSKLNLQDYGSDGSYNPYNPLLPPPNGWKKRASGGLISGGSGMRDDVPAMLSGGEFVLNNRATRKLGVQNLNRLNAGETNTGEGDSSAVTESLISKLDELIQATRESAGDNVVVNVSSNEAQAKTENTNGNEKELQRKIKQAVLDVIAQEKRLGGSLTKGK